MNNFNAGQGFEEIQKLNQQNADAAMKLMGEWSKGFQAIAAEMNDYTRRSFEESTATMEKLMSVKSLDQAFEIQSSYAKRAYDDYMHQMTKVGGMYANLAKDAAKPMEKAFQFNN
ncbi:MAG: phasin family protein [Alphaproteobacteria bacterium]|nr:phasin family protein [Alphaproteobacteria bacterium]